MARKPKQQATQPAQEASPAETAQEGPAASGDDTADEAPPPAQPEQPQHDTTEVSLKDAMHRLADDPRMRPHWETSIRKFADNHGVGKTATLTKWRQVLTKYGVRLKG